MTHTSTLAALAAFTLAGGSALAGTAPMPAPPPPPAPVGGPYLDISAGPLWVQDIGSIGFDTGWGINAEVGYALGNGLSFGLNSGYYAADMDSESFHYRGTRIDADGTFEAVPIMGTINYTFPISGPLSGYIGFGAGVLWVNGDADVIVHGTTVASASEDDWNFALQGRAGLSYAVSSNATINVGYRYLHGFFSDDDLSGHMAEGGVTIRF